MKILVTGATGFIGSRLCQVLSTAGHNITALSRDPLSAKRRVPALQQAFGWDALKGPPQAEVFLAVDAVIHLAGASIAGRWNAAKKKLLYDSRVLGTRNLVAGMESLPSKPKVLISASGIGYYGNRGEEIVTEESGPGSDYFAEISKGWEAETTRAEELGLRTVSLRTSTVLGPDGGALQALLPMFRLGLGGPLGSGQQWWSWIHRDDLIDLIVYALEHDVRGAINATAPSPVRQREFARTLGRVLRRPAILPAPAFALTLVLGEFASGLLGSVRAMPKRAQEMGFRFRYPELEPALREILSRPAST
jgi:uncharacterized protein (TIGR01777 family)